jgi:hypothetical protein
MFWFWIFMYSAIPVLYLPGMFGMFGQVAEDAAYSFIVEVALALLVILACVAFYSGQGALQLAGH